ncbi:MAG: hypothetical protein HRT58_13385 [Crocinitomicaceae bacterium]|nr:hypothetical protein [Flavobacteriales bacterium]NQZ36656.1 hypothetical protein [Crocinitomicaceae bacterium]
MKLFLALILASATLFSCDLNKDPNKEIDEGHIENDTYHSDDLGWTMKIPKGWSIITMNQIEHNLEKGAELFEEQLGEEVDYSTLKNLLAFEKNQFNKFTSTSQAYEEEDGYTWSENNAGLKEFIYHTFEDQGINLDSSLTRIEKIDGVSFESYIFSIKKPNGDPLFKQKMYSSLVNDLDFGVCVLYNNEREKNEMLEAWISSTFE